MATPTQKPDGGRVFPSDGELVKGLSLRDYFAGEALKTNADNADESPTEIARECYELADAMLAEREKAE